MIFFVALAAEFRAWLEDAKDAWAIFQMNNEQAKWDRENDPIKLAIEKKDREAAAEYAERLKGAQHD